MVLDPGLPLPCNSLMRFLDLQKFSRRLCSILLNNFPKHDETAIPRKLLGSDFSPDLWRAERMSNFQFDGYKVDFKITLNNLSMGVAITNFPAFNISLVILSKDVALLFGRLEISGVR